MNRIVVGVDGSEGAKRALEYAVGEATVHGARLRLVTGWIVPAAAFAGGFATMVDPNEWKRGADRIVEDALAEVRGAAPEVEASGVAVNDQPASALVHEAQADDLLVVGTRGHGGFTGLLLGSVSQQVVHHARCPVVIVPNP